MAFIFRGIGVSFIQNTIEWNLLLASYQKVFNNNAAYPAYIARDGPKSADLFNAGNGQLKWTYANASADEKAYYDRLPNDIAVSK